MTLTVFALVLMTVILNATAQLLLKEGMQRIGTFEFNLHTVMSMMQHIMINPYVILGLLIYVISVVAWLMVLSRTDVSLAYPMTSLGYIITALAGTLLFHEPVSSVRIIGIIIIITGVCLVTRS